MICEMLSEYLTFLGVIILRSEVGGLANSIFHTQQFFFICVLVLAWIGHWGGEIWFNKMILPKKNLCLLVHPLDIPCIHARRSTALTTSNPKSFHSVVPLNGKRNEVHLKKKCSEWIIHNFLQAFLSWYNCCRRQFDKEAVFIPSVSTCKQSVMLQQTLKGY